MTDIRVVLFDLGGVLLELRDRFETFLIDRNSDWDRLWIHSEAVREFERGHIPIGEFARRIVDEMDLPYGPGEFIERFDGWPGQLFPGTEELLARIPATYTRALLSNTNALHWRRAGIADLLEHLFDRTFLSYEIGAVKPDADAYTHVFQVCGCAPENILFLDDNPVNIDAASSLGMRARLARGIEQVAAVLSDEDIIGDDR